MKFTPLTTALAFLFICAAAPASAKWYTAEGTAPIRGDVAEARSAAIDNALRNILLEQGASYTLRETYENGVLQSNKMTMNAQSSVRKVQVLSEQRTSRAVTVSVKAWIDEGTLEKKCPTALVHTTILPIAFRFLDQQASQSAADITDLPGELDQMLFGPIVTNPNFTVRDVFNANFNFSARLNTANKLKRENISALAKRLDSQYIIVGTLNSVSLSKVGSNPLTQLMFAPTRTISFTVNVYDATTGTAVFQKSYSGEADWTFSGGEYVDLRSERFIQSSYGQRMRELANQAANEIMTKLECIPPTARVIDVLDDDFVINLGAEDGIREGMIFDLYRNSTILNGSSDYNTRSLSAGKYRVAECYPYSAKLNPIDLEDNTVIIQIDDLVTLNQVEDLQH